MFRFYFYLWLGWLVRVSVCSTVLAAFASFIISIYIYFYQNTPKLTQEVMQALWDVFAFCFPIALSLTLLIALFRSLKYIFNKKIAGYELKLLECNTKEVIEVVGYGDIVKVWRKWFMLIIWLVSVQMIIALVFTYFFTSLGGVMEWFNIYYLSLFIFIAGYISFIVLKARCKRVVLIKC